MNFRTYSVASTIALVSVAIQTGTLGSAAIGFVVGIVLMKFWP